MVRFVLYRLIQFPLILAIIYLLTFLLVWVAPGDPFTGEKNLDPIVEKTLKEKFHAGSAWEFLRWYPANVLTKGDFGSSMQYREWSVNDILWTALPVSITVGLFALTLALVFGVGVGTLAAVKRGGLLDWTSLSISLTRVERVAGFRMNELALAKISWTSREPRPPRWMRVFLYASRRSGAGRASRSSQRCRSGIWSSAPVSLAILRNRRYVSSVTY